MKDGLRFKGIWEVECLDKNKARKWWKKGHNLVTDVGINHMLDVTFADDTATSTWYIGLMDDTPVPDVGDTLPLHSGWTENSAYSGDRKAFNETVSGKSVTNSSNIASFSITSDSQTISGMFLCSASSGTTGTLMSAVAFTGGNASADNGDTLQVTYTISATDS